MQESILLFQTSLEQRSLAWRRPVRKKSNSIDVTEEEEQDGDKTKQRKQHTSRRYKTL